MYTSLSSHVNINKLSIDQPLCLIKFSAMVSEIESKIVTLKSLHIK